MADLRNLEEGLLKPGSLLHTQRLLNVRRLPLMMEFKVPPSEPYLVTSTRSLVWIPNSRNGIIRAAVRPVESTASLFMALVREAAFRGQTAEWGNVHPLTPDGIQAAAEHLRFYGLDDLQVLANPEMPWSDINPEWHVREGNVLGVLFDMPVEPAAWLDPKYILVVPKDRAFVGFMIEVGEDHAIAVVHNASRGIGIATAVDHGEVD